VDTIYGGSMIDTQRVNPPEFASGKEIEEFYDMYSESMYVDPAESTPDSYKD
jgi:hypothetical protein